MMVPGGGVNFDRARGAAGDKYGDFFVERDGLLDYTCGFAEGFPCALDFVLQRGIRVEADFSLASAVIAAGGGLAEALAAEGEDGGAGIVEGTDCAVRSDGEAVAMEPV